MSHRLDSPATLNVVNEGVHMEAKSLSFAAAKDQKRFALDLALHAEIDPEVCGCVWCAEDVLRGFHVRDICGVVVILLFSNHALPNALRLVLSVCYFSDSRLTVAKGDWHTVRLA